MAGISSKAAGKLENKKNKFQGQEYNDDLGVDMYEFKYRMDDPQTGRFWQVDPLADKYTYNSTYAFSENKVTAHVEVEGLEAEVSPWITGAISSLVTNPNSATAKALGVVAGIGNIVTNTVSAPVNLLLNPPDLSLQGSINAGMQIVLGAKSAVKTLQSGTGFEKSVLITEATLTIGTAVAGGESLVGKSTTLYRAGSSLEVTDATANGLKTISTGYETGKLFATSASDASQFGKYNFGLDGIPNTIMKVKVPNSVMKTATKFEADGMKAVSIPEEQLKNIKKISPLNYSPLPIKN